MKHYVIANWKLYLSVAKSEQLCDKLIAWEKKHRWGSDVEVVIAPQVLALPSIAARLHRAKSRIKLAAQDCGFVEDGASTGGVSPRELRKLGVRYVILGHSERRELYYEDEQLLSKKIEAAQAAGLTPIYCVGETKDERHASRAVDVVRKQIAGVRAEWESAVVAYEPRWAIGTGLAIDPQEADVMHRYVSSLVGSETPVCYGGSVSAENVSSFVRLPHTRGVLVGKASTSLSSLTGLISKAVARKHS